MNTTYILIGVCFLLNLIVVLAFRAADKKDRSLKNLHQQVKNFRYETTSFNSSIADGDDNRQRRKQEVAKV